MTRVDSATISPSEVRYSNLHQRAADGRCIGCGHPFPCPTGVAIYEAVKYELEHPRPAVEPPRMALTRAPDPALVSPWVDLIDGDDRCPACLHSWINHSADPDGCGIPTSTMEARLRGEFDTCGCQQRPAPGSEWAKRLACEAKYQSEHYGRRSQRV